MGFLDRFRTAGPGETIETPLVLARPTAQAFLDFLDGMRAEMVWTVASPHARNLGRLKETFLQNEALLRAAGKAIRACEKRAKARYPNRVSLLSNFEQAVVLEREADVATEGIFLIWNELAVLAGLSVDIIEMRGNWRSDAGWQATFSSIGGAAGPIYINSTRERVKVLLGVPTPCRERGAPVLARRESPGTHDLVRIGAATHHLERGLCRNCMDAQMQQQARS
jgi:hypothetical protein